MIRTRLSAVVWMVVTGENEGVDCLWFVVCGLWFVACGLWFCGLWYCGLWCVVLWFVVECCVELMCTIELKGAARRGVVRAARLESSGAARVRVVPEPGALQDEEMPLSPTASSELGDVDYTTSATQKSHVDTLIGQLDGWKGKETGGTKGLYDKKNKESNLFGQLDWCLRGDKPEE